MKRVLVLVLLVLGCLTAIAEEQKHNVVIFFTDDTGYRDIGPFGGLAPTPHLDRMATEGMKLTSFYVASVKCTPSRSALLTGCYASRIGMSGHVIYQGDARGLNPSEVTIAEMLKAVGYRTGCFGKWHLGDQPEFLPSIQGFDEYEGIPYSCNMWNYLNPRARGKLESKGLEDKRPPLPWLKGNKVVAWIDGPLSHALMNDAVEQSCVDFIDRNKDKPFFLYVPFPATHRPQIVLKERAKKIEALGCKDVPKYTQITEIDACVGKVMQALTRHGLEKNTFILYSNDNGGVSGFYKEGLIVPRGGKFGPPYEGTMRMATLAWWPGKIPAGKTCDELISSIDILPTVAKLTGATVPADRVIDGKDVSDALMGKGPSPNSYIFYGGTGIRHGNWKMVKMRKQKAQLYNLEKDYGETTDVARQNPELVKKLEKALVDHAVNVSQDRRPAGKAANPKYLLTDTTGVPTLAQYLDREGEEVYGIE
jgi:arylsulfatase A-like enzyme